MAGLALRKKRDKEAELQKYLQPKHPGSFSGLDKFRRSLKEKKNTAKEIKEFLKLKESYSLHHPVRYRFPRSRVMVPAVNQLWDADLLFMIDLSKQNDGWSYILTCVDVLSHYAFCERLKTKSTLQVTSAFKKILTRAEDQSRLPRSVRTDSGGEFASKLFVSTLSKRGIKHFVTLNVDTKAAFSER